MLLALCIAWEINNMAKKAKVIILPIIVSHSTEMEYQYGSFDGREDGEHAGVGYVEMSEIFVMEKAIY